MFPRRVVVKGASHHIRVVFLHLSLRQILSVLNPKLFDLVEQRICTVRGLFQSSLPPFVNVLF